jgi:integrase
VKGREAGHFLAADAAAAGIKIGRANRKLNGGSVLDFHSLRHTYISNLSRAGVNDGMREVLARASAGIVRRYSHIRMDELASIPFRMPSLAGLDEPAANTAVS